MIPFDMIDIKLDMGERRNLKQEVSSKSQEIRWKAHLLEICMNASFTEKGQNVPGQCFNLVGITGIQAERPAGHLVAHIYKWEVLPGKRASHVENALKN